MSHVTHTVLCEYEWLCVIHYLQRMYSVVIAYLYELVNRDY
jgi:hypothetical protein